MTVTFEISSLSYVRSSWADAWTEAPDLECLTVASQLTPGHADASFVFRYGRMQRQAIGSRAVDSALTNVSRSAYAGQYVKAVLSNGVTWYGILTDAADDRHGTDNSVARGEQTYTAWGLTLLLEKGPKVRASIVDGTRIGICIPFNGGTDGRYSADRAAVKNRSAAVNADGVYEFAEPSSTTELWTAGNAIQYLLKYFAPTDKDGSAEIGFVCTDLTYLNYEIPLTYYEGLSVWKIVNDLIDRRRGLVAWAEVNDGVSPEQVKLRIDSAFDASVTLATGSVPANSNQVSLDLDTGVNNQKLVLTASATAKCDVVRAIGERRGSVFTADAGGLIVPDWDAALQTEYEQGRLSDPEWSGWTDTQRLTENAYFRSSDQYKRVYSWWKIDPAWDGYTSDTEVVFPTIDSNGDPVTDPSGEPDPPVLSFPGGGFESFEAFWVPGLRIERFIPLHVGVDYETDAMPAAPDVEADFLPLSAWFGTALEPPERLDSVADVDEDNGRQWTVSIRPRDDWPGVILETNGGPQHYLAADEFTPWGTPDNIPTEARAIDLNDWKATIYVLQQERVTAQYPAAASVTSGDVVRVREVRVPDARLDYLVPGTVVAVDRKTEVTNSTGGWIRDDRERLETIARLLFEVYGRDRQLLSLQAKNLTPVPALGALITSIVVNAVSEPVQTIVSRVSLSLRDGISSVQTQHLELDTDPFIKSGAEV